MTSTNRPRRTPPINYNFDAKKKSKVVRSRRESISSKSSGESSSSSAEEEEEGKAGSMEPVTLFSLKQLKRETLAQVKKEEEDKKKRERKSINSLSEEEQIRLAMDLSEKAR